MFFRKRFGKIREINPDEVFVDSANVSNLDLSQMEGKIIKPISSGAFLGVGLFFLVIASVFLYKAWVLQVVEGSDYRVISENNRFNYIPILAERGFILSKDDYELAWNEVGDDKVLNRVYTEDEGVAHIVGYTKPPMRDRYGIYFRDHHEGVDGVEKYFDDILNGENGLMYIERDAQGNIYSESLFQYPQSGKNVRLSIDAELQVKMYSSLEETAKASGFLGGAALIVDIETGELLVAASYPEYDSSVMTSGDDADAINTFVNDERSPFLNRFAAGVFSPGSVMKPFIAAGFLEEQLIDPLKKVDSPGSLSIPNPYDPSNPSVFRDWRAHGSVDFHEAIAFSSNIYFYKLGGGYQDQEGLGITRIEKYARLFGFEDTTGSDFSESKGVIPTPTWKKENFEGDSWRLGDTYNTSIGQFGFQVTPLQMIRAVSSLANGGYLLKPVIRTGESTEKVKIDIKDETLEEVRKGMRLGVTNGTAVGLNVPYVDVAAKTGTAQTGSKNQTMNSWIVGFFPYEKPRYAFVVVLDESPGGVLRGGVYVMRQMLDWMSVNKPEYFE